MTLTERIKQIREYRGMKQVCVAYDMQISQQAYSSLEQRSINPRVDTLLKFCDSVKVDLPFLLALDTPIIAENMDLLDMVTSASLIGDYKRLKNRTAIYQELLMKQGETVAA